MFGRRERDLTGCHILTSSGDTTMYVGRGDTCRSASREAEICCRSWSMPGFIWPSLSAQAHRLAPHPAHGLTPVWPLSETLERNHGPMQKGGKRYTRGKGQEGQWEQTGLRRKTPVMAVQKATERKQNCKEQAFISSATWWIVVAAVCHLHAYKSKEAVSLSSFQPSLSCISSSDTPR